MNPNRPPAQRSMPRAWLPLLVLGFSTLGLLLIGLHAYQTQRDQTRAQVEAQLRAVGELRIDQISRWLAANQANARYFSQNSPLAQSFAAWAESGFRDADKTAELRQQMDAFQNIFGYAGISLFDRDGAQRLSVHSEPEIAEHHADILRAMQTGAALLVDFHAHANGARQRMLGLAAPLSIGAGKAARIIGAAYLSIPPQSVLFPLLAHWPTPSQSGETVLARAQGERMDFLFASRASTAAHPDSISLQHNPMLPSNRVLRGEHGMLRMALDYRNKPVLAFGDRVPGTSWILIAKQDKDETDAPVRQLARLTALVTGLLILANSLIFWFWWRAQRHRQQAQLVSKDSERHALQRRYDTLSRYASDVIMLLDAQGRILESNERVQDFYGYTPRELHGESASRLLPSQARAGFAGSLGQILATGYLEFEAEHQRKDGSRFPVRINARVIEIQGQQHCHLLIRDISEQIKAEQRLRQAASVFENTRDGINITDAAGNILAVNRAFSEITGYSEAEVLQQNLRLLKSEHHDTAFYAAMWAALRDDGHWSGEIWNRRKDGEEYPEWLAINAVRDSSGQVSNYISVFTDLSARQALQAKLEHQSQHHPLTGLPNVHWLLARLEQIDAQAGAEPPRLALLVLNIDRFAQLNDSLGRAIGDEVLIALAQRWADTLGEGCQLAHLSADQFAVLQPALEQPAAASATAARLLDCMRQPVAVAGGEKTVSLSLSIGIALYPDATREASALLHAAEEAMRNAKAEKGNQARFYDSSQARRVGEWFETENALRGALARTEFFLSYQPQVDVMSGRIEAVEALLRWRQGEEVIAPGRFIHIVEGTDLAEPVSRWVLEAACRQARQWLDRQRPLRVAVNLFSAHVTSGRLIDDVAHVLEITGLPAQLLELEVVESSLLSDPEAAARTLRELKRMGVGLALDDFGTGYSSLGYLKHYPFDVLKIDQLFTRNVNRDPEDAAIVRATIALAHNLGMRVLAEGVETESQLRFLARYGCDQLQGYLLSRPTTPDDVETSVMQRRDLRPADLPVSTWSVLLLEDSAIEATVLSELLQDAGYRVHVAAGMQGAIDLMGSQAIDLIIADYYLQHDTGVDILERLHRLYPETPAIMVSGASEQAVVLEALNRAAIRAFLSKPVQPEALLGTLRDILGARTEAA